MKRFALCLVTALVVAGCGSDENAKAPTSSQAASSGGTATSVAVSAKGPVSASTLCADEGVAKPKRQCTRGLKRLASGKAANPAAACKGLSKKKAKGVRGKSPYAVCVKAAARLMAAKKRPAKTGAADNSTGTSTTDESEDSAADDPAPEDIEPVCIDDNGDEVPAGSADVDDCGEAKDGSSKSEDDGKEDNSNE